MSISADYDVVVAGAGIAGSALALGLTFRGLKVMLVEPAARAPGLPDPVTRAADIDLRVSALSPATVRLLAELGVWERIPAEARGEYNAMRVWDAVGSGEVNFRAAEIGQSVLGTIVENRWLVAVLLQMFIRQPGAEFASSAVVKYAEPDAVGSRVSVQVSGEQDIWHQAKLLIGADGARSNVRELAGITTRQRDCGQKALVATVRHTKSHQNTAWQRFMPEGPLAFLPLGYLDGEHTCSIVWSADTERADSLCALDDSQFADELAAAIEFRVGDIEWVSPRAAFPLRQLHADRYAGVAIAIVADAAHVIHPLAGQGINLGLTDVAVLLEEIDRAQARGLPIGSMAVLGRYQRRRRGQNALMAASMEGFQRLFADKSALVRVARSIGMRGVDRLEPLKKRFMEEAMGL